MSLIIQIKSLIFSFLYGIFFSVLLDIFDKNLYRVRIRYQIINSFIFCFINSIIYFFILRNINEGIIHIYFVVLLIFGIFLKCYVVKISKVLYKTIKNKYLLHFDKRKHFTKNN